MALLRDDGEPAPANGHEVARRLENLADDAARERVLRHWWLSRLIVVLDKMRVNRP